MKLIVPQIEIKEVAPGYVQVEITPEAGEAICDQDGYSMIVNKKDLGHVHYALGEFIKNLEAKG